eukprot:5198976-Heterocapsa_arctica.AAC.1
MIRGPPPEVGPASIEGRLDPAVSWLESAIPRGAKGGVTSRESILRWYPGERATSTRRMWREPASCAKSTIKEVDEGLQCTVLQKIQQAEPPRTRRVFCSGVKSTPTAPDRSLVSAWKSKFVGRPEMHHARSRTMAT